MSHPSIFTVWESWKFSNCIFVIPKAFWLFLWQWEKSKMYSVIAADYFSEKNGEYFYGVIDQLDVSSEMSDDVMPAWRRQAVCKSQGYFFPPHRTCKAIWIIFYGLQQWGGDFCAKSQKSGFWTIWNRWREHWTVEIRMGGFYADGLDLYNLNCFFSLPPVPSIQVNICITYSSHMHSFVEPNS